MSKQYHILVPDDAAARAEAQSLVSRQQNIQVGVSLSFGNGPAVLVVTAPDKLNVQALTEYPATLVTEPVTETQSDTLQQVDAQVPSASEVEGEPK